MMLSVFTAQVIISQAFKKIWTDENSTNQKIISQVWNSAQIYRVKENEGVVLKNSALGIEISCFC